MMNNSAEKYNRIKRILFCTATDPNKGFDKTYEWMEQTYRKKLGPNGYVGLMAELKFYERYKRDYKLTVAADTGDHADFSGIYGLEATRFDITTNLSYKRFKDYEPFLGDGPSYRIVLVDKSNFEVVDLVPLAFERCNCGGYLIPFILLMDQKYSNDGVSRWSNDQFQMKICSNCADFEMLDRYTHHFLYSPAEFEDGLPEDMPRKDRLRSINEYILDAYKFFRREFCDEIMGVAEHSYKVTGRKGEGFWTFNFHFKNQVVANEIPDDVDCGLIS
jgi:hypothetical protein